MERAMMRVASWLMSSSALAVGLLLGSVGQAQAGSLNPFDFASLGAFPSAPGNYTFDTSDATLSGPGGSWTGVVYNGIAVFDFNSINVTAGQYFLGGSGSLPLALLSRSDALVSGTIDVSAYSSYLSPVGGPGGGGGGVPGGGGAYSASPGAGPGGGGGGLTPMPSGQPQVSSGGGGGGFGGPGGTGAAGASSSNTFPGFIPLPGGAGGASYGNLGVQLQGGSGGGGAVYGSGGGGGGAIELVAVGSLGINGAILANGSNGADFGAAGGSGGGIFLHADSVVLSGMLSAAGGSGIPGFVNPGPSDGNSNAGGGGGGGEVAIQGFFEGSLSNIDVSGGPSGGSGAVAGADGVIGLPEPASLVPMGTGVLFLLGVVWMRRKGSNTQG
jgi:hypothetical protein